MFNIETIELLKIGTNTTCSWISEYMIAYDYQRSTSLHAISQSEEECDTRLLSVWRDAIRRCLQTV